MLIFLDFRIVCDGLLPFDPRLTFAQRHKKASGNSKLVGLTLPQKQVCKDPMRQLKVNKKCHQFVFFGSNVVYFDHFQESANRFN